MEIHLERHEHVTAPLPMVWDEVGCLEQVLTKTPAAHDYEVAAGGERATFEIQLAWGPVKWAVDVELSLLGLEPERQISCRFDAPSLESRFELGIVLSPVGSGETKLDYTGHLDCRHRLASRLRGMFSDLLEEQMHVLVTRTKVRSEQRRLAQDRLLS